MVLTMHSCCCSVFWDLYCAAPDRRETCEHSSEAKAFHDYVSTNAASASVGGVRPMQVYRGHAVWIRVL